MNKGYKYAAVCKMSIIVHSRGVDGQIGSNLVLVVVECPLMEKVLWMLKISSISLANTPLKNVKTSFRDGKFQEKLF